jgi:dedicator of cytokinesis protein 3
VNTTNQTLRALLDRKEIVSDLNKLLETLQMFNFVGEEEIAKFVPAILDALFGFMVANFGERQDEIDDLVFQALVKVLSMTTDRRFANFDEVIDIYVANQFNFPPASFNLLRAMKKTMASPSTTEYRAFIKVWHLVFRFVFRARALDRSKGIGLDATSAHIEADFRRQIKAILGDIDTLVKSEDRTLIGTQTLAVQHYADILPHLSQVFTPMEIAEIVISFADALTNTKGSIGIHKLLLLLQVVRSTFDTTEARAMLVPAMIRWIRPHLGRYEEDRGDKSESQAARDARRIKWMECNRLAVTVSLTSPERDTSSY